MAAKREQERHAVPVVLLHDASTGQRVCVSAMWITTFGEMDRGTVVKFTSGDTLLVEEDFDTVANLFRRGVR